MKLIIGIDDTDTKETKGTGHLAEAFKKEIERNAWGRCSAISRHQLYVHDAIPYTSHNSAMCFEAELTGDCFDCIVEYGQHFLYTESAAGSDPGLCVAVCDTALDTEKLVHFGRQAQQRVLTKNDAYTLAGALRIHLSEHGGTGQGIIGAVAGIGLRLTGNDGRFRGWYHIGPPGMPITVAELLAYDFIDTVKSESGERLDQAATVILGGDKLKTVLMGNEQVVLVRAVSDSAETATWHTLTKQQVKEFSV